MDILEQTMEVACLLPLWRGDERKGERDMKRYETLFSPLTVKGMTLKNRVVMMPMGTNFAQDTGGIAENHIHYYEQRAKGGTGLIVVENVCGFPSWLKRDFPAAYGSRPLHSRIGTAL